MQNYWAANAIILYIGMSGFLQSGGGGGGTNTPTGPAGGDLGGTYPDPTVTSIQGNPVEAETLGALQDGYVLTWVNADGKLEFLPSPSGTLYSHFFALMPSDNSATIAVGAPVLFPQNGPSTGAAASLGGGIFNLPSIGTYEISWQVSVSEAGQLSLAIGGVGLPDTVVGRAALTSQIVGFAVITTVVANSHLSVINPAGNSTALTITPDAGGNNAVSATLTIKYNVSGSGGVPGVPPTGPAFGDLSGNYPDPIVVGLQGHAISSSSPLTGNLLEWTGSDWTPSSLNLAGGSNYVTGALPSANQAAQTMGGAVGGTTAASTINLTGNASITGSLPTTNQVAQSLTLTGDVTGSGTTAGTTTTVAKIQGVTISGAPLIGYVLEATSPTAASWQLPSPQTMGGDVTGTTAISTVAKIQGNAVTPQSLGASQDGYTLTWNGADWLALPINSIISSAVAAPGTPAYNPTWYAATNIYWDPAGTVGGSDANSGTVIGSPLLTFAEIVRRYGSTTPEMNYGQNVTIHQLTSQPAGIDPVFFSPLLSGGGYIALIGTLIANGASSTISGLIAKNRTTNTFLQISTFGSLVQRNLIYNVTRNSYAFAYGVGGGVATMTQPIPASVITTITFPTLAEDDTWANGDTVQAYELPFCNLKQFASTGGDALGTSRCASWLQFIKVSDSSSADNSFFPAVSRGNALPVFSACHFTARTQIAGNTGDEEGSMFIGCSMDGFTILTTGPWLVYGGCFGTPFTQYGGISFAGGDCLFAGGTFIYGGVFYNLGPGLELSSNNTVTNGGSIENAGIIWGGGAITIEPGSTFWNVTGSTFASTLFTGTLMLGSNTTGSSFNTTNGLFASGIPITPANLDTNGGLQDPSTGARFANTSGGTGSAGYTAHSVLVGGGTGAIVGVGPGTSGQVLIGQGVSTNPSFVTLSGGATVSNTGVVTLSAINLAGGSSSVTGILPAANQAAQTMGGDVTGTTAAATVVAIQGNAIQSGTLGAPQDGYVLTWTGTQWAPEVVTSGSTILAGDVTGISTATHVISITGASGVVNIASTGNIFTWAAATTAPGLTQAANTTASTTGAALTIQAQNSTGSTSIGGNLVLTSGTGTSTNGTLLLEVGGTTIGSFAKNSTNDFIALGAIPSTTGAVRLANNTFIKERNPANSADVQLIGVNSAGAPIIGDNTQGGAMIIQSLTNISIQPQDNLTLAQQTAGNIIAISFNSMLLELPLVEFQFNQVSPVITQVAQIGNSATTSLTIAAQSAFSGATGTNQNGGNLLLNGGLSSAAGSGHGGDIILLGGQQVGTVTKSAAYTVDTGSQTSDYVIFMTGNAFTVTLPAPTPGRFLIFKDIAGNASTQNKTIAPHASETIDGASSYVLNLNYAGIKLISDGTNWWVTAEYNGTVI
jgi:hypothetical protein